LPGLDALLARLSELGLFPIVVAVVAVVVARPLAAVAGSLLAI